MKPAIHGVFPEELKALLADWGLEGYRAKQVWDWLYQGRVTAWDQMKNLPRALKEKLADHFELPAVRIAQITGAAGETRKMLVALADGEQVEAVLLPAGERRTVCISSQVGCKFKCAFCASGMGGFSRNLAAGELVGQVLLAYEQFGGRPDNVVFMGMGEPLDNYDEVLRAIRILNHPEGLALGARRLTLSTCGVIPGINRLATEGLQVELSVSLHAPEDRLRARLMPVNQKYPLQELLAACRAYTRKTKRIITFEYTLIKDVNDSAAQAEQLARLLAGMPCRVNLIPLSPVEEFAGQTPVRAVAEMFIRTLQARHINATLRDSKGAALKAACGQLRRRAANVGVKS